MLLFNPALDKVLAPIMFLTSFLDETLFLERSTRIGVETIILLRLVSKLPGVDEKIKMG